MKIFKKFQLNSLLKLVTLGLFVTFFASCEQDEINPEAGFLTDVELSTSSEAERYTSAFLPAHENCGGHTIERHIEKSDSYLYGRLNSGITAASTFYNYNQAGQVIYNAIYSSSNYSRLTSWLNSSSTSYLVLYYTHSSILGKVVTSSSQTSSNKIKVVLSKSSCISYDYNYDNDFNYTIVTAYPY